MKDLAERFAEIERRIKPISTENRALKKRVRELEKELNQARCDMQKSAQFNDKQVHLRERIETILRTLETVDMKKN
jgi:predicted RNase H-like nuclease (RuvC/YqgF family)